MADVRLRLSARADLADILAYSIEAFGEAAGKAYLKSFDQAFILLERYPRAGVLRLEINPPIHCLHHRQHRIFYDTDENVVSITRVLHHARDAAALLRR